MPIATTEQYAGMLGGAAAGGCALAGVNVSSSETLNAALCGFAEAHGGGILQVSTGGGEFLSGTAVKDMVAGARALAAFARVLVEPCPVLVALDTDHCSPDSRMGAEEGPRPALLGPRGGGGHPGWAGVRAARIGGEEPSAVSGNIAVIYARDLAAVAEAFGEAAGHLATRVRLLRVGGDESDARADGDPRAGLGDFEWADGIAFGTPIGDGSPAPILMRFIASTEPLWSSGRLYDKAVTVFTDEPEHFAPDSLLHPIYDALYRSGAVIIGPRAFELALDAHPTDSVPSPSSPLPAARLRPAQYRAARLARLAGVLADDRHRHERFAL